MNSLEKCLYDLSNTSIAQLASKVCSNEVVMIGEASHGTKEFYYWRQELTKHLLKDVNFKFIGIEGDWPAMSKINDYVIGKIDDVDAAFSLIKRWPRWMWANEEFKEFIEWLRIFNLENKRTVKVFGLDVYSSYESINHVLDKLETVDIPMHERAREKYSRFDPFSADEQEYLHSLATDELVDLLKLMMIGKEQKSFDQHQKQIYRTMMFCNEDSWNVRDHLMMETFDALLQIYGKGSKGIIWAHNTHVGDYRATDMARFGLVNIGGLGRQRYKDVCLVGFGSHEGSVTASQQWAGKVESLTVPPSRKDSWENVFVDKKGCYFLMCELDKEAKEYVNSKKGLRAIGVVYHPEMERVHNYVPSIMAKRFDVFIFVRETQALRPL